MQQMHSKGIKHLGQKNFTGWGLLFVILVIAVYLAYPRIDREVTFYDSGIYLSTAKSLASGEGYRNLSLPDSPRQGKYPPGLPFLLSIVWRAFPNFPENLLIMKSVVFVLALCFLILAYVYFNRVLERRFEALAFVAMVGLNAAFTVFATQVSSEILYALLSLATIYFYDRFLQNGRSSAFALVALFGLLAFFTRTIGVLLLGAVILHLIISCKWRAAFCFTVLAFAGLGSWFWWGEQTLGGYSSYPLEVRLNYSSYPAEIQMNYSSYRSYLGSFGVESVMNYLEFLRGQVAAIGIDWSRFIFPWSRSAGVSFVVMFVGFYGLAVSLVRERRLQDYYCFLYLLTVSLWPWLPKMRFLIVIGPFLVAYFFFGLRWLMTDIYSRAGLGGRAEVHAGAVVAAMALGACMTQVSSQVHTGGFSQQRDARQSGFHKMVAWIGNNTPENAILVGGFDPLYYLYTKRKAIRLPTIDPINIYYAEEVQRDFPQTTMWVQWLKSVGGCHVIEDPMIGGREDVYYHNVIEAMKRASGGRFSTVYHSVDGKFVVYKMEACGETATRPERGSSRNR